MDSGSGVCYAHLSIRSMLCYPIFLYEQSIYLSIELGYLFIYISIGPSICSIYPSQAPSYRGLGVVVERVYPDMHNCPHIYQTSYSIQQISNKYPTYIQHIGNKYLQIPTNPDESPYLHLTKCISIYIVTYIPPLIQVHTYCTQPLPTSSIQVFIFLGTYVL